MLRAIAVAHITCQANGLVLLTKRFSSPISSNPSKPTVSPLAFRPGAGLGLQGGPNPRPLRRIELQRPLSSGIDILGFPRRPHDAVGNVAGSEQQLPGASAEEDRRKAAAARWGKKKA